MGILDRLRFRNRIIDPNSSWTPSFEPIGKAEAVYVDMTDLMEVYHSIPHIKCAINAVASMSSNGVYRVVDSKGDFVDNHQLTNLLNSPNFLQHKKQFDFNYTVNKKVNGTAFIYKNSTSLGIQSLFTIPTEDVKIEFTKKMYDQVEMKGVISSLHVNQKPYDVDDIIFLKENDDRIILGEPKLRSLKQQISNIKHTYDARNVNITQRGATGIISLGNNVGKDGALINPMSPIQKENAEKELKENYGIGKGQNQTMITTANVSFIPMSFPTKDLMLFEEIEDDNRVILDTFGLNDNLFSKIKGSTFNNLDSSLKRVYQDTIIPESQIDASQIGRQSGLLNDGEHLTKDFSHLPFTREDEKHKAEIVKLQLDSLEKALALNLIDQKEAKRIYDEKKLF